MKYDNRQRKKILKELVYRYIPQELLDRPKQGFAVPLKQWFKNDLRGTLEKVLADRTSPMWFYFDQRQVANRIRAHETQPVDSSAVIWRLLFFYYWCEAHLR